MLSFSAFPGILASLVTPVVAQRIRPTWLPVAVAVALTGVAYLGVGVPRWSRNTRVTCSDGGRTITVGVQKRGPGSMPGPLCSVEVARQCSNLAPSLQSAVSAHREIRRRHRTAAVSQGSTRPLPKPVPRLTEEMLDEAERRYRGGEILRAIAGDLGVSRQRLAERLRERGVRLRREKPSSEQVLEMCRRYEQGESLARIGERLGFNPSSVRLYLLRVGMPLRNPHGRGR